MDLKSGYPYWLLKNGLPDTHPSLKENISCEVLIIGGGISGVLAAYHLANAGYEVTVVDRRHFGTGSTCATTALIQYETDEHLSDLINKYGVARASRCYELTLSAVEGLGKIIKRHRISCEYEQKPSLYLASLVKDKAKLLLEYEARINAGFDVQLWSKTEIDSRFGFSAAAGIWSENSAQLDALKLTYSLIKINSGKGVSFFDGTSVKNIFRSKNKFIAVTGGNLKIKTNHVVVTCGYESEQFMKKKVSKINSTYAVISEPLNESQLWYRSCLIWESARPYIYMRTTADNRIIIGGKDEPFYNPKNRDSLLYKKSKDLSKAFNKKFPHVPFTADFSWTGTFAETKDSLPYIDTWRGIHYVMGFGGNGITFSQMAGSLLVDLLNKTENPDLRLFSFKR